MMASRSRLRLESRLPHLDLQGEEFTRERLFIPALQVDRKAEFMSLKLNNKPSRWVIVTASVLACGVLGCYASAEEKDPKTDTAQKSEEKSETPEAAKEETPEET